MTILNALSGFIPLFASTASAPPAPPLDTVGEGNMTMLTQASDVAANIDFTYYFILWTCTFFFVLITGAAIWFIIKYRHRPGHEPEPSPSHSTPLELTWSILPSLLLVAMFWFGFEGFMQQYTPAPNAVTLYAEGQKWNWNFIYPNNWIDSELHLHKGQAYNILTSSQDVLHSFFIPAFRVKRDVVPGRYNTVSFTPTRAGTFALECAEYCGTSHWSMYATVVVHETKEEYDAWLKDASNILDKFPPAEAGQIFYQKRGCTQCHSVDGSAGIGPTFLGFWDKGQEVLDDGTTVAIDENYIRNSILNPQEQIVAGYDGVMPTYRGRLNDDEIRVVIEYMKTLKE